MFIFIRARHIAAVAVLFAVVIAVFVFASNGRNDYLLVWDDSVPVNSDLSEEFARYLEKIIRTRDKAMLENEIESIKPLYNVNTRLGTYAFEHEKKKIEYLQNWAEKQGVNFQDINTFFKIRWVKEKGSKVTVNFSAITEYTYVYINMPGTQNRFRIATYHLLELASDDDNWLITKEWYTDPFADSLNSDTLKAEDNKVYILSQEPRDFSNLNERRIKAVEYADLYCGASDNEDYYFRYNNEYKNYNSLGGDCTNFASQALYAGGFRKTGSWNYEKDGSRAWVNAQGFKDYLLYSGRGSLIVHGTYDKVLKLSYKLLPGDIIAYEKKGKVAHISVVTGADSRGYTLVNCHNTDRFRVPWDLGWSDKGIKFWLIRVNY
ncbi:MAG: amidase domain-containing protein [Clostridiaceae bacterium]|nr:amidase domain-containing protein [Clostridiaceae bacterium]